MELINIKVNIYLSKIDLSLDQEEITRLLQFISNENRNKCKKFSFKVDVLRTLYGELIIRYILCKKLLIKNECIELRKGNNGKPYVKDFPVHFNVSHAGDYVVVAIADQEIGIDIEQMEKIDMRIAKRILSSYEYDDLVSEDTEDQLQHFYSLWTLKESYVKLLGTGLSMPLDSFGFRLKGNDISFIDHNNSVRAKPYFKQYLVEGYKLSVCSMTPEFPNRIERISIKEITQSTL